MRLPASEVELFYKLHPALLLYVNQQLGLARHVTTIPQLLAMPEEERYALRSAFYEQRALLDTFIQERSYWILGSDAPPLSKKRNSSLSLLKNKGFKEERMTKVGWYAVDKSTTLESNKSQIAWPRLHSLTPLHESSGCDHAHPSPPSHSCLCLLDSSHQYGTP